MSFGSYFWSPRLVDRERDPSEMDAFKQVIIEYRPVEELQKYFRTLLKSEKMKLKGFALDRFYTHESQAEKPEDNPYHDCLPEVLAEARTQLRQPPDKLNAKEYPFMVGANHASAFLVLSVVGTISDLDLIEPILNSSDDLNVIYTGCLAAIHCIETTIDVHPPQVFPGFVSIFRKYLFKEFTVRCKDYSEEARLEREAKLDIHREVRKQIQDRFCCYYWNPFDIIDPLLGQAYILLVYSSNKNVLQSCYHQLLTSNEPVAIGIALDRYSYAQKQDTDNPYAIYASETLEIARAQLQQPPIVSVTDKGYIIGANYDTALLAISCLEQPEDTATSQNKTDDSSEVVVSTSANESDYWSPLTIDEQLYPEEKNAFVGMVCKIKLGEDPKPDFSVLLKNDNPTAKGYALDRFYFYQYRRKPEDNPFYECLPEVLAQARAQLQQPPVESDKPANLKPAFVEFDKPANLKPVMGANHASAFLILSLFGTASDLDLIEPILNSSEDLDVIYTGCLAAIHCLSTTINDSPRLVFPKLVSILRKYFFDDSSLYRNSKSSKLLKKIEPLIDNVFYRYYNWYPSEISDPRLGQAFILMICSDKLSACLDGFYQLLMSDEIDIIHIALEQFCYIEKNTRFGLTNHYLTYLPDILAKTRELLTKPHLLWTDKKGQDVVGTADISALSTIKFIGEKQDVSLIKNILSSHSTNHRIIQECRLALRFFSSRFELPYDEQLIKLLKQIVLNDDLEISDRVDTLIVFKKYPLSKTEEWLIELIESPLAIEITSAAAYCLTSYLPKYQDLLEKLVRDWNRDDETEVDSGGYHRRLVQERLAEESNLNTQSLD